MDLPTRIAAARRQLRRLQEDYPLLLKRIESHTPEEKALAVKLFEQSRADVTTELEKLEREAKAQG